MSYLDYFRPDKKSPVMSGIIAGLAVEVFSDYARRFVNRAYNHILDRCFTILTIEDNTEAYDWINYWFHNSKYYDKINNLSVKVIYEEKEDGVGKESQLLLTPGSGNHLIKFNDMYFMLNKYNESQDPRRANYGYGTVTIAAGRRMSSMERNVIALKCLHKDKEKLLKFIEYTKDIYDSRGKSQSTLYQCSYGDWYKKTFLMPRTLDTIALDGDVLGDIIKDIKWFLENKNYYQERGIPYRRGFLFYGPPGTGKTSTIIALANYFDIDVYYIDIGSPSLSNSDFVSAIATVPHNSFLVIEDIDTAPTIRKKEDDSEDHRINIGTILNSIDGLFASEGRVLFMTTNKKELISNALLRPGRCDKQIYFGYATEAQIRYMTKRFFSDVGETLLKKMVSNCKGHEVSPALLQEVLMIAKNKEEIVPILAKKLEGLGK